MTKAPIIKDLTAIHHCALATFGEKVGVTGPNMGLQEPSGVSWTTHPEGKKCTDGESGTRF